MIHEDRICLRIHKTVLDRTTSYRVLYTAILLYRTLTQILRQRLRQPEPEPTLSTTNCSVLVSVAEPARLAKNRDEIIARPDTATDLNQQKAALDDGYQVALTRLYASEVTP